MKKVFIFERNVLTSLLNCGILNNEDNVMDDKRKHFKQMTPDEYKTVLNAVKANCYTLRKHAVERMTQKNVTEQNILAMLTYCQIVECHNNNANEIRVLVRGKIKNNWCNAVLSLTTKEVVTTYWNQANDLHATLDWSKYKWNADLTKVIH